jgi:hypothetical protein
VIGLSAGQTAALHPQRPPRELVCATHAADARVTMLAALPVPRT